MARKAVSLSEQVRRAIRDSGLTQYRISKEAGIDRSTLHRFMTGERGLPMKTLDRLAEVLDLRVSLGPNAVKE